MASNDTPTGTTKICASRAKSACGTILLASALTVIPGASTALAQDAPITTLPKNCEQAATERVSAMGLTNTVTRGMSSEIRSGTTTPSGYRVRYFNPNCGGYVVMNFNGMCGFEQTYTTGNCRMQGMPHWW